MPPKSLLKLATDACVANIRHLFDVGEAPYHVVRPVLLKIGNPQQLREIEKASPQICGADAEIWQGFIKRDIPNWESKIREPKDPKNWWKVYRKLKREADEESSKRAGELKAKLQELSAEKESQHITFDHSLTVPAKRRAPPVHQTRQKKPESSMLHFRSGSRTKTTTGKSILQKARREAREATQFGSSGGPLATPTHLLGPAGNTSAPKPVVQIPGTATSQSPPKREVPKDTKASIQAAKEEAAQRRQRALAQQRPVNVSSGGLNPQGKRNASNVFLPTKKRKA